MGRQNGTEQREEEMFTRQMEMMNAFVEKLDKVGEQTAIPATGAASRNEYRCKIPSPPIFSGSEEFEIKFRGYVEYHEMLGAKAAQHVAYYLKLETSSPRVVP